MATMGHKQDLTVWLQNDRQGIISKVVSALGSFQVTVARIYKEYINSWQTSTACKNFKCPQTASNKQGR